MEAAGPDTIWGFIVWTGWCVVTCLVSTSCGYFLSPASDGSGIPRMRALFAGVHQNPADILSVKAFVARSVGTVFTSGSGLSVGRSGPFSHIMSIIAYQLSKFPLFRRVYFGPETFVYLRAGAILALNFELVGTFAHQHVLNSLQRWLAASRRASVHLLVACCSASRSRRGSTRSSVFGKALSAPPSPCSCSASSLSSSVRRCSSAPTSTGLTWTGTSSTSSCLEQSLG